MYRFSRLSRNHTQLTLLQIIPDIEESTDAQKPPSAPPSISALAPEDLKALEEGMKLLRGEKKA